jgi:hypothetical protein
LAHETITKCMMHGPCGVAFPNAPCMENGKWKKQYPCKFQSETVTNVNGYPIYRCRYTRRTVLVHGVELNNRWVVLHNVYLSTKYYRNPSLGLTTKTKVCKGAGQEECERMWEWKLTLPSELPFWEFESWWTRELSKNDYKSQNTSY